MKTLVIAEKPSVGRDIARVLKCSKNRNGAIEGNQYIVTWGLGHLVTLSDPEQYDPKYKEWNMQDLPMIPKYLRLEVIRQTGKQFHAVKFQINRKDVKEIVIATDAGREGELVARWILEKAGNQKPVKRLWISSVTDKAIRQGFANLKPGKDYDNLYRAAVSRAEADWLVGINATRALTCKYNAQLSCGRVQTPTLAMIAKREEEIRNFKPVPYYGLTASVTRKNGFKQSMKMQWIEKKSRSNRSFDKDKVESLLKELKGQEAKVVQVSRSEKKKPAPQLYDLTELQREANKKYDFSAKETLNIMQRLYENHKVLTYPRTDSRYLTTDIVDTIKERLQAISVGPYRKLAAQVKTVKPTKAFVDNSKVSDHHAIIPTEQYPQLEHMSLEERKIYDLVVKRFLAVLYPAYEYEQTSVEIEIGGQTFTAKGNLVKKAGWKEVYDNCYEEGEEENTDVIAVNQGEWLEVSNLVMTEGKTKPPAPFNEATLLSAMENPVKYMESRDKEDIKTLGETGGLGTVATRADIIEKLFHSYLLEKKGKDIHITAKAKQLLELVPADLKKPELTADWERKLSRIAKGSLRRDAFMADIKAYTNELIEEIKSGEGKFRHDNLTNHKCPNCGKYLLLVKGKNSTKRVCQDRECGYKETVSRTSNARCPKCHKRMELFGTGDKQMFTCVCGHKEKLAAFQERRKKEGAGVSKKDVAKYMNKMKKEDAPLNTGLAAALAKLELD
ncbi:DNA topoisomerase III [[Clostridium] polysaccharolyticum]|uniref:DNA topoisomerase 3 n=1 Tax=[Clostridium] polysaccharolyticum TaxID=29364 RepID=A0A1H9Y5H9_9FIRM|nr:DNA topoisomerase III [[Clostridium] polysaccharolyticum]SES63981.1 DNA topoisomerase-3 [[Clostridium] polysaccharolyticum]